MEKGKDLTLQNFQAQIIIFLISSILHHQSAVIEHRAKLTEYIIISITTKYPLRMYSIVLPRGPESPRGE